MTVEWRPIPSALGYAASSDGRILGKRGRPLRPRPKKDDGGRLRVNLLVNGEHVTRNVHVLVAEAFLGPMPQNATQVRHLDDNVKDNRPENLAYGTALDNAADKVANGHIPRGDEHYTRLNPGCREGEKNGRALLTAAQVLEIFKAKESRRYGDGRRLAQQFGVSTSVIKDIWSGRHWARVTTQQTEERSAS